MKQQRKPRPETANGSGYKLRNWKEYNQALQQRGSLEIWIDEKLEIEWYYQGPMQRGAQFKYSEKCIELACIIKEVYRLPYRQTAGFIASLIKIKSWDVEAPDYTVINRRHKCLKISLRKTKKRDKIYIAVDSTGAKVYGEGEWKVRQHGWSQHRTWRKIHIAVDERTGIIESCATTTNGVDDAAMVGPLLNEIKGEVHAMAGDGAYDKNKVYEELAERKIKAIIPPRKDAKINKHGNIKGKQNARDRNLRNIRKLGRKNWKKKVKYHRRSIAETTMFRLKNKFGDRLTSREYMHQVVEVRIKCSILNRMILLGKPDAYQKRKAA